MYGISYRTAWRKEMLPSSARTTNGNTSWFKVDDIQNLSFLIDITAITGTLPTMNISVEVANNRDGDRNFVLSAFAQMNAISSVPKECNGFSGSYVRLVYTFGGSSTPGMTFSMDIIGKT